jgi:hypothetical protein
MCCITADANVGFYVTFKELQKVMPIKIKSIRLYCQFVIWITQVRQLRLF